MLPAQQRKKVLLMGKCSSGKTSMRSVIFSNFLSRDTARLGPTYMAENCHYRFLNGLVLNLWDCGGQDRFYRSYFEAQRDIIFRGVELLVYVFDVKNLEEKDIANYRECLDSMAELSPGAKIFVLVHKIDPKDGPNRAALFKECEARVLARSKGFETKCYATSIFDDTLVNAWSDIVCSIVPNVGRVKEMLGELMRASEASEVVLFERSTFLVVAHTTDENAGLTAAAASSPRSGRDRGGLQSRSTQSDDDPTTAALTDGGPPKLPPLSAAVAPATEVLTTPPNNNNNNNDASNGSHVARFQKISTCIKRFRMSSGVEALELRSGRFSCLLDRFTESTYVLFVLRNEGGAAAVNDQRRLESVAFNLNKARPIFERVLTL